MWRSRFLPLFRLIFTLVAVAFLVGNLFADAEITCNAVKNGCRIEQIPIATYSSESYKGMNIVQGLSLIFMIIFWRLF